MTTAGVGVACDHCGQPVPPSIGADRAGARHRFCCGGCAAVWAVLHEHGLERYYALRVGGGVPARATGRSYAELDDAAFQGPACRPAGGGLLATELYLEGVHCSACVWLVERLPQLAPGLVDVRLDLPRARAAVRWDPSAIPLSAIARLLDSVGYAPHPCHGLRIEDVRRRADRALLGRIGIAAAAAGNVMGIAFALYGGMFDGIEAELEALFRWVSLLVTVPAVIWGGGVFFTGAWAALRVRTLHMDLPISLGILAGFVHGAVNTVRGSGDIYFDSVTAVIVLLLVGRFVLRRQQRVAADAADLLASLSPSFARVLGTDGVREVPLDALTTGTRVEVRAGDTVPADGVVVAGHSTLDVALLSGEALPVEVEPGDPVHAGTVNLSGRLEIRVERAGAETRVGRLMALVEEHARRRAPIVQLADRLAGWFVAAVLALAGLTLAIWLAVDPERAVSHAVAVLIVSCPCALGLATPLALGAAVGRAARAGLLVKGADVLEALAKPGRMWLDKTGTLTTGRLAVVAWRGDTSVKPLVAALEAQSSHPVARALAMELGAPDPDPVVAIETPGRGIDGYVGMAPVVVGAPDFVASRCGGVSPDAAAWVDALTGAGLTPVLVAVNGAIVAAAGLGDVPRPDASAAVARIRAHGWEIGVLSGDHPRAVAAVGRPLGIDGDACRGGVSPEAKLDAVTAGVAREPVVMVGDGMNDAAALAAATVGIAVHGGAEAAMTTADASATRPGVGPVADLLDGACRTMRVVRRNLIFSLAYNAAGVALAMAGWLNPLVAAILMPLSSLTVVISSYRADTFTTPGDRG